MTLKVPRGSTVQEVRAERAAFARQLFAEGSTREQVRQAARSRFGQAPRTDTLAQLKREAQPIRVSPRRTVSPLQRDRVAGLVAAGQDVAKVAQDTRLSQQTVRKLARSPQRRTVTRRAGQVDGVALTGRRVQTYVPPVPGDRFDAFVYEGTYETRRGEHLPIRITSPRRLSASQLLSRFKGDIRERELSLDEDIQYAEQVLAALERARKGGLGTLQTAGLEATAEAVKAPTVRAMANLETPREDIARRLMLTADEVDEILGQDAPPEDEPEFPLNKARFRLVNWYRRMLPE